MDLADQAVARIDAHRDRQIHAIHRALANVNTTGVCQECGCDIDKDRLKVYPAAQFCISCATKKEKLRPKAFRR